MKFLVPQTLRNKMIVFTVIIVSVPIFLIGYLIKLETESALLAEKQSKLFGIAALLDMYLGEGFDDILMKHNAQTADKATQIQVLNQALKQYTDTLAEAYPGIGAGYYSRKLDAIITYGPSSKYSDKVGIAIAPTHPGREVMSTGKQQVAFAPMVRGDIMNAMLPIVRHGEIIGYIWANELTDDIYAQMATMDRNIYLTVSLGMIVSLLLFLWLNRGFIRDIDVIKNGLEKLRFNLSHRLPILEGEMGQITQAINDMAHSLLNAQTLTQNIMQSMADGVITVDINGTISSVNKSAEILTGYTCAEIIGKSYKEIFCEGRHFHSLLLDTLETGTNYIGIEMDYPVKDKSIYVSISTTRLKDSTEKIIGAVVVFKDLTEKHRLQAQMHRAERLASLGELMAGVAHEIRNPLTAIKGFVQYLQNADSEAERQEYMPVIIKEVDRVNRVIETLLYFSRPCKTNYLLVDINELIEETLILIKNTDTKHRLEFKLELDKTIPRIEGDAEQLKQVLLNLLINAVQAIPSQGIIEITTWRETSNFVHIKITDTGCGISQSDLDKIFDPFFTTKAAGTGLGLAVVQRIINAHYGQIDIQSKVGQGTAVTLQIPVIHPGGDTNEQQLYCHGSR